MSILSVFPTTFYSSIHLWQEAELLQRQRAMQM